MISSSGRQVKLWKRIFWALCSLKLAVIVIFSLAVALAVGTILESTYDTPTSQYWVYQSVFFHFILGLLGVNIFCVAISRYPWKKNHIPFLMAHLGILILLAGSWISELRGVDGNLRVTEGESSSVIEMDSSSLIISEKNEVRAVPIPWRPTGVAFHPIDVRIPNLPSPIVVDQFLTHADPIVSFVPEQENPSSSRSLEKKSASALKIRIVGGFMGVSEEVWLWEGENGWKSRQIGPLSLSLGEDPGGKAGKGTSLSFIPQPNGDLVFSASSTSGAKARGTLKRGKIVGEKIDPKFRGGVVVTVVDWIPSAVAATSYKPARIQHGAQAPSSAIHITSHGTQVWLGLGDRAVLHFDDPNSPNHEAREVNLSYFPRRLALPFAIRLDKFMIEHDQGTLNPAAYSSRVTVLNGEGNQEALISMNEPLKMRDFTVYQASYEDGMPRPTTSIFAVNRDPGRPWKYLGSLLIVLGAILLFAVKYRQNKNKPRLET